MKNTLTTLLLAFYGLLLNAQTSPPNESCGKILNLNGDWEYIKMNPIADSLVAIDDNDKFTVEFWMKTTASSGNIFSVYTSTEFVSVELYIKMHGGKVGTSETFSSLFTESAERVNDDEWHHVAMSFNGDIAKLYVDGVYYGAEDYNFFFQNNTRVGLGMADLPNTGIQEFFKGQLDEVKIWQTVRTEEEIVAGMGSKLVGDEAGLLAYFDFDEGNNSEPVHNNSPYDFNFKITSDNLPNTRLSPDGLKPTLIENVILTDPSCVDLEDGKIEIEGYTTSADLMYSVTGESGLGDVNLFTDLGEETYKVLMKDSEGCYDSTTVELDDGEPHTVVLEYNDEFSFFDAEVDPRPSGGYYLWINCDSGDTLKEGSSSRFYPEETGYFKAVYAKNESCTYSSDCAPFGDVNVDEVDLKDQFEVYPNPTNGVININFDSELEGAIVTVYNITGSAVKIVQLNGTSDASINLNSFVNGLYFVEVSKNESTGVYKVIKK